MRRVGKILYKERTDVEKLWRIFNDYDIDIDAERGRYTVDAKSLMGLMMFLGTPVDITLPGYPHDDVYDGLRIRLKPWEVE